MQGERRPGWPVRIAAALTFVWAAFGLAPPADAGIYAAVVMNADTSEILYSANPDRAHYPASLAKMMTLYLTFEALEQGRFTLGQRLPVSAEAARQIPSKLYLGPGDFIRVEDAILALVTKSANDVAVVLAEALSGSERAFAQAMTARARQLGMGRTTFRNASGLHDRYQYTTARDMAKLGQALQRDFPRYFAYLATVEFTYQGVTHENHNPLLGEYAGTTGIKTGYVRAAGYNLTASVERGSVRLIGVVLGGDTPNDRDRSMVAALDAGFRRVAVLQRRDDVLNATSQRESPVQAMTPADGGAGPAIAAPRVPDVATVARPSAARPGADWSVQVGAYRDHEGAEVRLEEALSALPLPFVHAAGLVLPGGEGDPEPLYRARLTRLTQDEAMDACKVLRPHSLPCLVIPPGDGLAAGSETVLSLPPWTEILQLLTRE